MRRFILALMLTLIIPNISYSETDRIYLCDFENLDAFEVPSGTQLWMDDNEAIQPQISFINNGTIKSYGHIDLTDIPAASISSNGIIEIGSSTNPEMPHLKLSDTAQLRKLMASGLSIGDEMEPSILEIDNLDMGIDEFYASRQIGDIKAGRLTLQNGALIKAGTFTVTGEGNRLGLGWQSFYNLFDDKELLGNLVQGLPSEKMATIKSREINIFSDCPPPNEITVISGNIMAAGEDAKVTIGRNGDRTLRLTQSVLTLGDSETEKGTVNGHVVIGTNAFQDKPGAAMIVAGGEWLVNGNIDLTKDGYFNWNRESKLVVGKDFKISGCDIALEKAELTVKGTMHADIDTKIDVTDSGKLVLANAKMNGAQINFDPEFLSDGDMSNGSMGAIAFENGNIDARINVGRNSMLVLGYDNPEWLRTEIENYQNSTGALWGHDITAALAITSPQTISPTGGIRVDGSWTTDEATPAETNKAYFGSDSLLAIDAKRLNGNPALSGGNSATLEVASNARLLIADASSGDTVIVAKDFASTSIADDSWIAETTSPLTTVNVVIQGRDNQTVGPPAEETPILPENPDAPVETPSEEPALPQNPDDPVVPPIVMPDDTPGVPENPADQSKPTQTPDNPSVSNPGEKPSQPGVPIPDEVVTTPAPVVPQPIPTVFIAVGKGESAKKAFPKLSWGMANILDNLAATGLDTQSENEGVRFLSRAADNRYLAMQPDIAARTIESASRFAAAGGVPQMIKSVDDAVYKAISGKDRGKDALAIWISPLYANLSSSMSAGELNYDFNSGIGGVAIGADYEIDNIHVGVNFNIGGGYGKSGGDFSKTTNNMDFWGLGAYAGLKLGDFSLNANLSFLSSFNKVKQELPSSMVMKDLKSDIKAKLVSTGLIGNYKFDAGFVNIIPHAGVKYTNINVNSYSLNNILKGSPRDMNIWEFPVGVKFAKDFDHGNFKFAPFVDLEVIQRAGDTHFKDNALFAGRYDAVTTTQMFDSTIYGGSIGISLKKNAFTLSVKYDGQFGPHSANNVVSGNFMLEF